MNKTDISGIAAKIRYLLYGKGLGSLVFYGIVIIAVLPLAIVSFMGYDTARHTLHENVELFLQNLARSKADLVESYLVEHLNRLQLHARQQSNSAFLERILRLHEERDRTSSDFFRTPTYRSTANYWGVEFRILMTNAGYTEIMLLDTDGTILFSAAQASYVGRNLFEEHSPFSRACRAALTSHLTVGTDLYKGQFTEVPALFFVQEINDQEGDTIGLLAFGVPYSDISRLMQKASGTGMAVKNYLFGADRAAGEHPALEKEELLFKGHVDTVSSQQGPTAFFEKFSGAVDLPPSNSPLILSYKNGEGREVLAVSHALPLLQQWGLQWWTVAEVDKHLAYAQADRLKTIMILYLFGMVILVFIAAAFLADHLVAPLKSFSTWARQVARGDLVEHDMKVGGNELGEMHRSFLSVVQSFRAVADVCEAIAAGNLEREIEVKSDQDVLARAVNEMAANLRQIIAQADSIADGKSETEIIVRSESDMLGKSLRHMTEQLRRITEEHKVALDSARKLIGNLNNLPAPVFTIDRDFRVTYINPAGAALTPRSQEECMGATCQALFRTSLCHTKECPAERVLLEAKSAAGENIIDPEGLELPVSYMATPLFDEAGNLEGTVIYFEDISQRLQVMEELQKANLGLREQAEALLSSEEALQARQRELVFANRKLEERTEALEEQQISVLRQNVELEAARHGLEQKTRDLEQASRYKTEFLANMSHELRTPLNSMLLLSKTLSNNRDGNLTERQVEFAKTIYNAGSGLLELINEILDLSKVEAGKITVKKSTIEIRTLADGLHQIFEELARGKGITFTVIVDEQLPDFLYSDRMRVEQILKNFLSNAFKFTETGSVSLSFSRCNDVERFGGRKLSGEGILMTVTDSGIGIPAEMHDFVFEEFQQVDGTMTRKYGGTGLGLSISKKLAELLGGEIILLSEKGWGSSFSLVLPLPANDAVAAISWARGESKNTGHAGAEPSSSSIGAVDIDFGGENLFAGKKVLLVDDDMRTVFALTAILEGWGINILFAKKLEEALMIAKNVPALDLVLVDDSISDAEGQSAMTVLKTTIPEVPVVAMSNEKKRILSGDENGGAVNAYRYLPKPCDPARLRRLCAFWMPS